MSQEQGLSIINPHPSPIPGPVLLHELVAPPSTATAIDFLEDGSKRRTFSYRTLHSMSDALAQKITKSLDKLENASPIVPVLLPQSAELYIVLLAILKAGKAFCPLSLDTPAERLNFILDDISADLLITNSAHGENVCIASNIGILHVDEESFREREHCLNTTLPTHTNNLAYVLYTSGSTGLPKAVCVSHRAATQSLLAHDRHIPRFTRFLQFAAPTFDVSVFEIFFSWYRSCTLSSRTRARMLDNLPETIRLLDIDAVELTPTVVSNLLEGRSSVPSLGLLLTIGEMLTPDIVEEYGDSEARQGILWAMYGPTEAAIHCTLCPRIPANASTQMIGFPLDTVSAFVVAPLSEEDSPSTFSILPTNEEGELVVGGPQVAEEYLNRPELTVQSFLHHPKYGYLYRTGDRAKLRKDGTLECLGRVVTGQVKLRGQRVELGEIEQIIMKVEGCRATTVKIIDDHLVAFCATGSNEVTRTDVWQMCKQWLPNVMVPSEIVLIHRMPQLGSGKIDQNSLIKTYRQTVHSDSSHTDSAKTAGNTVLRLLQDHMKRDLTPQSNLTSAGVDSLQAIRLASKLRAGGHQITTLQILSATTVEDVLKIAKEAKQTNGDGHRTELGLSQHLRRHIPELEIRHAEIACVIPCTPLQEAMLAETVARSNAYCNWVEIEIQEHYSFEKIKSAVQRLARCNEILRSGFHPADAEETTFVQVVWRQLNSSQVQQVSDFSKSFALNSLESFLQPFSVQVRTCPGKPRLLFQIHHSLYDGWSLDLIIQDLEEILRGNEATKRPQYSEVVRYHNERTTTFRKLDEEYWASLLRDRPVTSLPNFNGRNIESASLRSVVGRSTVDLHSLTKRSRELQVSPQVWFQAAITFISSLYVGSSDMVIGNVTSGRTIPVTRVEDIVGPCIASLPFRLRFDREAKVKHILHETQQANLESLKHFALPLRDIAKAVNVQDEARLFDVLFVWQQSMGSASDPASSAYVVDSGDELEFTITFEFEPHSDHISFRIMYDPSKIPENQVNLLSGQIDEVVQYFLEDTDRTMTDVAGCFPPELCSIANPVPLQRSSQCGPALAVEKWASDRPDQTALSVFHRIDGRMEVKATVTYEVLNSRANRLARVLESRGVYQGCIVAVVMDKSIELYIAILAILKLGAGYLPLVPDLPEGRMRTILIEAEITVCISNSSGPAHMQGLTSLIVLDIDKINLAPYADDNISIPYDGARIAYAVYTSGSTGTPKGVLVTQDNLMSNLEYLSTIYPYSAKSRLLQSCSQAFDVSVFEIFFSWHVGMCLCTAQKDDLFTDIEGAINQMGITHLSLTPTVAALIDPDNVPRVEFLVTAGEAVTEYVRRKWTGRGLYQGYGPSETTNICTVRSSMSPKDLINNIGKPFDNTSAFVLDPNGDTILPRGAIGELCFGGYQVFQGYLNRPDLTAAKIINHPSYGRIYRSGDLGVLLDDDSILFSGRLDDQVKVRGQRVELGEISFAILDQQCVRDCSTLQLHLSQDSETLVTFWAPTASTSKSFAVLEVLEFRTDVLAIYAALSHRLPTYMVPSHLIPISRLPMTMQGKIDKRLLQQCFDDLSDEQLDLASPSRDDSGEKKITAEWEVQVAKVLAATLRISPDKIRRTSSFFNLGLDSVSAISFSNRLRKSDLGDFAISEILKNATIAYLATLKDTRGEFRPQLQESVVSAELAIGSDEIARIRNSYAERDMSISKIWPCTPLQEAMLSSAQSTPETSYSNMMVFSVTGDLSRLQESWALMVRRHEILRTSFVATSESSYAFAQVVSEDASLQWGLMIWSSEAHEHANKMVADLLHDNKPPVWLAIAKSEHLTKLLFCCHHAVYDGTAVQTLLKEVQEVYHQHTLPPPVSFDAYLQSMLSQNLAEADKFWTTSFRDFESTAFPDLTGRTHKKPPVCSSLQQGLRLPLSEVLEACQNASVTLLSVIHATWVKLLYYYTGTSDVCFGNVVSGRALPGHDLERLVAPCFNTLPVRVNFDPSKQNIALSNQAHACNVESFAYQLTPLRRIQNIALKDGGRLFDTLVILQQPAKSLDLTIWTLEEDRSNMDLPLVCEISQNEVEDRLDLTLHYHSTILSEKEASIVAETFDSTLTTIINHPDAVASDTSGLSRGLQSVSNTGINVSEPRKQYLHSGFETNAQNNPDGTAIDFLHADGTRTTWSYRTLNDKANDIAHALIGHGVKTEQIVPVHITKGPIFYASILGVLKAGAAFAPVHPDLPEERRRIMLEDLRAGIILCTSDFTLPSNGDGFKTFDAGAVQSSSAGSPVVNGLSSANLAYCIFTSGSTGVPKAVSMEHRAPMQTIECSRSLVPWGKNSRLLQYAATTFDMCYFDCFLAWTFGFTLCAAEQDMMLNELPQIINSLDADLLDLTPSVATTLIRSDVPNVKWLYCIGEAMTPDIVENWQGACVNSYGPSEAAFCTTIYPVSKEVSPSVIGAPFPSTSFAVFPESEDHPLPLLSIGELYIGGAQLARGYFSRPELTAEKFVTKHGQKFYRSGDNVRMLSDGNFEFTGRADDQVKIRGLRVELGEINNTLRGSHEDITAVVTQILKKDTAAKEQLVAFLVTRQPTDDSQREEFRNLLKQAARHRLPPYMVPQFFIFVDKIPRSPAGKVDKRALSQIFQLSEDLSTLPNGTSGPATGYSWTALQRQIRNVFARLSNSLIEEVLPTTTIYQLGLDSISAVQIATALRREGQRVNATDVMKYLTCVDLAAYLEQDAAPEQPVTKMFDFDAFDRKHRPEVLASCKVTDGNVAAIRPCTPLQRGMLSQMLAKEGAVYVNYLRLELEPEVDLNNLRRAWEKVMALHQMLRTGFMHLNDKDHPFGMIEYTRNAIDLPWNIVSESDAIGAPGVWLERLQRLAVSDLHKPLWKIRVICMDNTKYLDLAIFHALFDAQSLQSILRDVATACKGQDLQNLVDLNPVVNGILQRSISYSDKAKEFWTQMGKQAVPSRFPNLAPLRYEPQPPMICSHRSKKSFHEIQEACRQANTTLQAVGIASWLSLISAYMGEPIATCGVVLSGRSFEEAEIANFPCINTVPFAHAISDNSGDMLDAVTSLIAEVQQHQHIPLSDIQRLMGYPNEALFDTIFAYQKLPAHEDKDALWRIVDENATIEYPVSIELDPNGDYLDYRLTTMPHSIPREQAGLMLEQLDLLIHCFIFTSEKTKTFDPSLYSITPAKEPTLPSEAQLLHDFVELTAKEHPGCTALEFAKSIHNGDYSARSWTYSELDAEGNRLANLLILNGVRPGDLVGVCFDKCPEASFAMLGVLKAGGAFVAIDPGAPAARQAFIVQDSGATAVLSMSTQSAGFARDVNVPVLNLDETTTSALPDTKPTVARELSPQDLSYCLYTSGTTGTPKGCELTHENAVQALLSFQRLFAGHWDAKSRWLQFASFHFDVSVLEQYWSWSVGICVVSAPRDVIFEDLANSINTLGITHIDLTPSLAQILHPDDVPSLCKGVFITGGESLKQEILDVWGPKGVIYNGYGPTEATIGCTMYPRVPANGKPSNIGPQFDNVGSFVLRPGSDIPVLRGGVGELCVSGKLVGKGYLNRDELTEKSFPYLERFKERVYRTGDLVRILHDGTFEFLGRADDQVKLRGQRLEIGEINSVIRQSNRNISDVATLVLKHPRQQKEQLVAFVVQSRMNSDPEVLLHCTSEIAGARDACHDKLPPYMVPTHFVSLSSLPLNVNNKADAKKLKAIYEQLSATDLQRLSATSDERGDSWSSLETKLCTVLIGELSVNEDAIGKETSFFELGMDSISVIGVVRALKQANILGASASLIMKHSTIRRLAKALSTKGVFATDRASVLAAQQAITAMQHRHRRAVARSLEVDTSDIEALSPCTPLQHGMIAKSLESEDRLYFNRFTFELADSIDVERLKAAWQDVYDSTQILRTVFVNTEEGYVQAVSRHTALPWKMKTATAEEDPASLRKVWLQSNHNDFIRPFELIYLTSSEKGSLFVHIFHGLYDGISIEIVFKAVWSAYNGRYTSTNVPPFQSALAYGPLRTAEGAKTFWQGHFADNPTKSRNSTPSIPVNEAVKVTRELRNLDTLEPIRRKLNVTAQAIAQACWLSVLQEHKQGTVTTGVVVSGRSIDLEGADRIIGPMFNTIPYQHRSYQSESWASIIKRVHDFNVAAHPYQHTSLRDIIKWCKIDTSQPLFDNLFVYQVAQNDDDWADNEAWQVQDGEAVADYPMALEVEQRPHGVWKLTLVTQGHVYDEKTSQELLERFETVLQEAMKDPARLVESSIEVNSTEDVSPGSEHSTTNSADPTTMFEWTEEGNEIRKILAELTNVEVRDIAEGTSILELGLDSIDAIKLSSKLKKVSVNLPVSGIMRGLTVPKMLPYITKTVDATDEQGNVDAVLAMRKEELRSYVERQNINPNQIEDILPLTPLQEAMVAEMVASEFTRYYNFDVMKLEHDTDVDRLRDAWTQVVGASPILRTSFIEIEDPAIDGSFAQIIRAEPHDFWSATSVDDEPDFPTLFEQARKEARQSFSSEPPFYVRFVKSSDRTYFFLSIAHALYDGWSLGLIHADVKHAYEGSLLPRPDYQPILSEILKTSGADASTFWGDYLFEAKPSTFAERSASEILPQTVHRLEQSSKVEVASMTEFAKKGNVSLQTLGQSVFAIVLASYTRALDVTFGSVLSGRDDDTTSQLLFPTMNTVAIRTILHGSRLELLRHVQDSFTNVKQWQHFPLRKALALAGTSARLFESLFIYQKSVESSEEDTPQLYKSIKGHSDVEYPVCVEMEVVHEQLIWRCAVKDEVFDRTGSNALLKRLDEVLREIVERPDRLVIDFTSQGISLCGLSPFEERSQISDSIHTDELVQQSYQPQSETVRTVRQVLALVSGTPENEITDDMTIFHIGLDSISAIKVSSLLRRRGVLLSVGEMLRAGNVNKMAQFIDARTTQYAEHTQDNASVITEALHGLDLEGILHNANLEDMNVKDFNEVHMLPATAGQVYMLSMWLNTAGSNFYPEFTYKLTGHISFEKLQTAWRDLVNTNPILRTYFVATRDQRVPYVQLLWKDGEAAVSIVDNTHQGDQTVGQYDMKQPWTHLHAAQGHDGWTLKLKIHHALYDGVSLPVLMHQLQNMCNGSTVPAPDETLEESIAKSTAHLALSTRKLFWTQYLDGVIQHQLPQPHSPTFAKTEIFTPALLPTRSLENLARHNGISIQALFLATYANLYARITHTPKEHDVILGIYLANRALPIAGIETAAIPTVNLLPLRVRTPLAHSTIEVAKQIQHDLQRISELANANASLHEIKQWTGVTVDSFVNFLTLPSTDEHQHKENRNVTITPVSAWTDSRSHVVDHEFLQNEYFLQKLKCKDVNEAYLHAVDIEVTVRNGALDVGIFAPVEIIGLEVGKKLLGDLKGGLKDICE